MFGSHMGCVVMYIRIQAGEKLQPIWLRSKDQGDRWRQGKLSIYSNFTYQVTWMSRHLILAPCSVVLSYIALGQPYQNGRFLNLIPHIIRIKKQPWYRIQVWIGNKRGRAFSKKAAYVSSGSKNGSAPFLQCIVSSASILSLALKDNHWWHQRRWWFRGCSPGRLHLSKRTLPGNRYRNYFDFLYAGVKRLHLLCLISFSWK